MNLAIPLVILIVVFLVMLTVEFFTSLSGQDPREW